MNGQKHRNLPHKGIGESAIIRYIRDNPDFWERNPWLLENIEIPHACGDASSLVQRQVSYLRRRNNHLCLQMMSLIGNAESNERVLRQLHHLSLSIIQCADGNEVLPSLQRQLADKFHLDFVESRFEPKTTSTKLPLHALECGPISPSRWKKLFETHSFGLRTAVLIPFSTHKAHAVLGLGSKDRKRFTPNMSTLFWEQLGETVAAVIKRFDSL